jgi:hypothetical protein
MCDEKKQVRREKKEPYTKPINLVFLATWTNHVLGFKKKEGYMF